MIKYLIKGLLVFLLVLPTSAQQNQLYFPILDAHNHQGFAVLQPDSLKAEFDYLSKIGYKAIIFPLPADRKATPFLSLPLLEKEIQQIKSITEKDSFFYYSNRITKKSMTNQTKSIAYAFSIEYFKGMFSQDLSELDKYKKLGIHYITLIDAARDSLFEENHERSSLSLFGQRLVKKMNELDLCIDISHLSESQMLSVMATCSAPVIASHNNARGASDLKYNLSDTVLKAIDKNNGIIMLSFNNNGLLSPENQQNDPIKIFVNHIDYVRKFIDINHIGIGTDLQAHGKYIPTQLNQPDTFIKIQQELENRNYTKNQIKGLFYKNYINFIN